MVLFPSAVFEASKTGVNAWWNMVFPALLPFFISSELLMGYGVVHFMGVLLEPVMRPLFNLPGAGSFVMAVGYTSGFPVSASLVAGLRRERLCTRLEAERLMCFTNNASPLFMLVAVGVGMFHNSRLGIIIALTHYAANIVQGLLLRFYKTADPESAFASSSSENRLQRAVIEMRRAYRSNPRPFGRMLSDAIFSSINKLLVIGGFVIAFSVIIRISSVTGIMSLLTGTFSFLAAPLGFTESTIQSLGQGFFEITLGAKAASEASAPLAQKAAAVSVILGWSGVSVLAQVAAMISETDLKMGLFILSRLFHSVLSGLCCFYLLQSTVVMAWLAEPVTALPEASGFLWLSILSSAGRLCLGTVFGWVFLALTLQLLSSLKVFRFRI